MIFMELTKYEIARLMGARALQLAHGAPPLIKVETPLTFLEIAETEFKKNILPLAVARAKGDSS